MHSKSTRAARRSRRDDAVAPSGGELRAAASAVDRASAATGAAATGRATGMWEALVSARWSLVDHFQLAGRRFLLLKLNARGRAPRRALSVREREIALLAVHGRAYKLIAAELGLGISTVAGHVDRALEKLGVSSRAELICVLGPLASVRVVGRPAARDLP